jgi:hypothetical protein
LGVDRREGIDGHFGKQERVFCAWAHWRPDVVVKRYDSAWFEKLESQNGITKNICRLMAGVDADEIERRRVLGN